MHLPRSPLFRRLLHPLLRRGHEVGHDVRAMLEGLVAQGCVPLRHHRALVRHEPLEGIEAHLAPSHPCAEPKELEVPRLGSGHPRHTRMYRAICSSVMSSVRSQWVLWRSYFLDMACSLPAKTRVRTPLGPPKFIYQTIYHTIPWGMTIFVSPNKKIPLFRRIAYLTNA